MLWGFYARSRHFAVVQRTAGKVSLKNINLPVCPVVQGDVYRYVGMKSSLKAFLGKKKKVRLLFSLG